MTDLTKYAEALFLLSDEEGVVSEVLEDLSVVNSVLNESPEYARILDTPSLSKDERLSLLESSFGGLNEYVKNVMKMLCQSHSVYAFSDLFTGFSKLYNEKLGIVEVEAVSSVPLTEEEKKRLEMALCSKLSKNVVLKNAVDKNILGGLVLRYGSVQLDSSLKMRLDSIKNELKKVVI